MANPVSARKSMGFTLLEVMIASSIMALVFIGFMTGFVQATRLQYMSDRNYCASVIARNRLEGMKVYAFGTLSSLQESMTQVDRNGEANVTGEFWRTTSVSVSGVESGCVDIVVEVWYLTKPGVTSEAPVEVRTMIGG